MWPGPCVLSSFAGGDKTPKRKGCGVPAGHSAVEGAVSGQMCRVNQCGSVHAHAPDTGVGSKLIGKKEVAFLTLAGLCWHL